jgi:hypothetical protein
MRWQEYLPCHPIFKGIEDAGVLNAQSKSQLLFGPDIFRTSYSSNRSNHIKFAHGQQRCVAVHGQLLVVWIERDLRVLDLSEVQHVVNQLPDNASIDDAENKFISCAPFHVHIYPNGLLCSVNQRINY